MSPLANAIYKLLVRKLRGGELSLTYGALSAALPARVATHQRSSKLHAALDELADACRATSLPCLPAMVWRADSDRPGPAYFRHVHGKLRGERVRGEAWEREHAAVVAAAARYPVQLAAAASE